MLAEIRPSVLGEWMAEHMLEPWGEIRSDLRMGLIASTIANVNRDPKKRSKPYQPDDFMPFLDREEIETRERKDLEQRLLATFGLKVDPKAAKRKKRK